MAKNNKVIFTRRIYIELLEYGIKPIETLPNPGHPEFDCWVYERNDEFINAYDKIMENYRRG